MMPADQGSTTNKHGTTSGYQAKLTATWFSLGSIALVTAIYSDVVFGVSSDTARFITMFVGLGLMTIILLRDSLAARHRQPASTNAVLSETTEDSEARKARVDRIETTGAIVLLGFCFIAAPLVIFSPDIFGVSPDTAKTLKRWAMGLFLGTLYIYTFVVRPRLLKPPSLPKAPSTRTK